VGADAVGAAVSVLGVLGVAAAVSVLGVLGVVGVLGVLPPHAMRTPAPRAATMRTVRIRFMDEPPRVARG
jgi:hypothetical protein